MPSVTIWLGVTTDSIGSPTSHVLSFGTIEGEKVTSFHEAGLDSKNLDWFQSQILRMIEILKLTRAEAKINGVADE